MFIVSRYTPNIVDITVTYCQSAFFSYLMILDNFSWLSIYQLPFLFILFRKFCWLDGISYWSSTKLRVGSLVFFSIYRITFIKVKIYIMVAFRLITFFWKQLRSSSSALCVTNGFTGYSKYLRISLLIDRSPAKKKITLFLAPAILVGLNS